MSRAQCAGCELDFTSDSAFDKHRVGSFEPDTRRCLTLAEMGKGEPVSKAGNPTPWRQNGRGWWTDSLARPEMAIPPARSRFSAVLGSEAGVGQGAA